MGVLGVDGCRDGWAGLALDDEGGLHGVFGLTIGAVVERASAWAALDVIAIDIPIGLPETGRRAADLLARALLGPRRSSVFVTPTRAALREPTHAAASARNRALAGQGVSTQAFALRTKILEVDAWVRTCQTPVLEVHPEVTFAEMAGAPLPYAKRSWAGAEHRRALLATQGLTLPAELGELGARAAVDDVLDAAATAWSACRFTRGEARSLPDPPSLGDDGIAAAIWR